jgi:preprotein translocase subunit SecE
MKKQNHRVKKDGTPALEASSAKAKPAVEGEAVRSEGKTPKAQGSKNLTKKTSEKNRENEGFLFRSVGKTVGFFREARGELKKVKWPTRKELLASTAVVLFLVFLVSFYLGLVDFGLIKIIRAIVG